MVGEARARGTRRWIVAWVSIGLIGALSVPARAGDPAPTYVRTIGLPGHADIYPGGIDVDDAGNVYITDTGNDQVVKYPAGSNTPAWRVGTRGASMANGNFAEPRDVAVASNGRIYVADTGHGVVQVLGPDGSFLRKMAGPFRSPIGISVGTDGFGNERILVSNGGSGNVDVFDVNESKLFSIPPRLGSTAGTRDAATDPNGNIYVADYRHDRIQKYSRTGAWLLEWGGPGVETCKRIPRPYGVDVDDQGRVYVAASNNNLIRAFQGDGTCIRTYGVNGLGEFQTSQLRRVAVTPGPSPQIFGADLWGIKVLVYAVDGSILRRIGSWPKPAPGRLNEAHRIAVTGQHVFVTNTVNHRIDRLDLDGSSPIAFGTKGVKRTQAHFNWPQGVAVNPATSKVWVVDTRNSVLKEFALDGSGPVRAFGQNGTATGSFRWPLAATFDGAGNMYVVDTSNNRVQSFSPSLSFRWSYGSGGTGLSNLKNPNGIAFDPVGGRILVADTANSRIVALSPSTGARLEILPIAKGSALGAISGPKGVAVDASGRVWVADTQNHRVQAFTAAGVFTGAVIGGGGFGSSNAKLNHPTAVAFAGGLLYVADTYNDRVQVFQP